MKYQMENEDLWTSQIWGWRRLDFGWVKSLGLPCSRNGWWIDCEN